MSNLLSVKNLHKSFVEGGEEIQVLRGLDLELKTGERLAVIGESGVGKSTLLHVLGTLDRPTAGQILYQGKEIPMDDGAALSHFRNREIGFVFQFHYLLKEFTAQENVALPMFKLSKLRRSEALDRAADLLGRLGLAEKVKRRANRLSGGEQQRVAIARALANEPSVLLADEPTGNLDRANGERVAEVFQELSTQGQTIVMVTHDLALANRARRLVRMEDGHVIEDKSLVP